MNCDFESLKLIEINLLWKSANLNYDDNKAGFSGYKN